MLQNITLYFRSTYLLRDLYPYFLITGIILSALIGCVSEPPMTPLTDENPLDQAMGELVPDLEVTLGGQEGGESDLEPTLLLDMESILHVR